MTLVVTCKVVGIEPGRQLRNFDIFEVALNCAESVTDREAS